MSDSHKDYLRRQKHYHIKIRCFRIILLIAFLSIWELAADYQIIDAFFFSSPSRILQYITKATFNKDLLSHIGCTLFETIISFISVMSISLLIASVLWYFDFLADLFEPTLVILNSLPKSALAPLFIVWLGTGMKTIIIAGISVAIFGSVISIYTQFMQTDEDRKKLIITLGGQKKDVYFRIVVPYALPSLVNLMKVNIGLSLVGVIIGEFLAARRGLGNLIIYGTQVFRLDMVISSIIILCVMAYFFYIIITKIEKKIPNYSED